MPTVETVNGPIDVEDLGLTLIHEHFRATDEAGRMQFPHLYDEQGEWEAALSDANAVKGHGVKTVVEPSAMFLTRDAAFSKRVADESGLNVILATGVYTYDYLPPFLLNRDRRNLRPRDRERHPGHGYQARVHQVRCRRTGRDPDDREDPPGRRPGDTDDLDYIDRLLDTGCWIGMDRYGLDIFLPTERRNATVLALLEKGRADRMFLSQDYCSTVDWFPLEAQGYLKANEVPKWSMVENPKRWLASA